MLPIEERRSTKERCLQHEHNRAAPAERECFIQSNVVTKTRAAERARIHQTRFRTRAVTYLRDATRSDKVREKTRRDGLHGRVGVVAVDAGRGVGILERLGARFPPLEGARRELGSRRREVRADEILRRPGAGAAVRLDAPAGRVRCVRRLRLVAPRAERVERVAAVAAARPEERDRGPGPREGHAVVEVRAAAEAQRDDVAPRPGPVRDAVDPRVAALDARHGSLADDAPRAVCERGEEGSSFDVSSDAAASQRNASPSSVKTPSTSPAASSAAHVASASPAAKTTGVPKARSTATQAPPRASRAARASKLPSDGSPPPRHRFRGSRAPSTTTTSRTPRRRKNVARL